MKTAELRDKIKQLQAESTALALANTALERERDKLRRERDSLAKLVSVALELDIAEAETIEVEWEGS